MANEIENIIKTIQFKTDCTMEEIANKIGYSRQHLIKLKKQDVANEDVVKLLNKEYKEILQNVILNEVFEPSEPYSKSKLVADKRKDLIPLYDVKASAGNGFVNLSENVLDYIRSEHLKGCTGAIIVSGDSMNDALKDKDIIGLKPIENYDNIEFGCIYAILTKGPDYELFVKYVRKHKDPQYFILRSKNENYDDIDIKKDNIKSIWKQKGIIRY